MAEAIKLSKVLVEKRVRVKATKEEIIAAETKGEFKINKTKTTLTTEDIKGIPSTIQVNTPQTTVTANYVIEKIPTPTVNNVSSVSSNSVIWNRQIPVVADDEGTIIYLTDEKNIISSDGKTTHIQVSGDPNAIFKLVVKDITNTKWYDWENEEFSSGYQSIEGVANSSKLLLNIPPQAEETTYNLFLENIGSTNTDLSLPTEEYPWVINQLPNPTITLKIDDLDGFNSDLTTTITHLPNINLSAGSTNDGLTSVNITAIATRGVISLNAEKTIDPKVLVSDIDPEGGIEVLDSNLIASINSSTGAATISGTIKLGQSTLRDSNIIFHPNNFFTIT